MNHPEARFRRVAAGMLSLLMVLALAMAGLIAGGLSSPVAAATGTRAPVHEVRMDDSCGYPTTVDSTSSRTTSFKAGKGRTASVFFQTEKYSYREVHTDPATGRWFVMRGTGRFQDTKAKPLGGNLFEMTRKDSGQRLIVEDANGRTVYRAVGDITFTFVIDTHGDDDPAWDFVEFRGVRDPGPPVEEVSPCKIAGWFFGTGSADRLTAHPVGTTSSPLGYYEYLPPGYGTGAKKPLLLFFHGAGASGDGSPEQLPFVINDAGIPLYISTNGWPADRPFVVLAPQHNIVDLPQYPYDCQDPFAGSCVMQHQHDYGNPVPGSPCTTPNEVKAFLDYALAHYDVDPTRVYLTGLSCGGYGVWEAIPLLGPGRVAAAVPIAGEGRASLGSAGCALASVPIWAFHGDADDIVNPKGSIDTVASLRTCPAPPAKDLRLTVYPGVDHDSWDHAYSGSQGQDIYSWMLRLHHHLTGCETPSTAGWVAGDAALSHAQRGLAAGAAIMAQHGVLMGAAQPPAVVGLEQEITRPGRAPSGCRGPCRPPS